MRRKLIRRRMRMNGEGSMNSTVHSLPVSEPSGP